MGTLLLALALLTLPGRAELRPISFKSIRESGSPPPAPPPAGPVADGEAGPAGLLDPGMPEELRRQILGDLEFVRGIRGSGASPLHRQVFGEVDGADYLRFFRSRIRRIVKSPYGADCGLSAVAMACYRPDHPGTMWLLDNYRTKGHPRIARVMALFHEARHAEGGPDNDGWMHGECPVPFRDAEGRDVRSLWTGALLRGQSACDETPLGSYGISVLMLKNIARYCLNCDEATRREAGFYADDQLSRITDPAARRTLLEGLAP